MRVGFTNGCFDLFHEGHSHFLQQCRRYCDYLVVAVNSDEYCRRIKGSDRPYDPLARRMVHVRALAEAVFPFEGRDERLIMEIRPDVVLKGSDHSPSQRFFAARVPGWKLQDQTEAHRIWKCPVVHIPRLPGISTTLAAAQRQPNEAS